MGLETWPVVRHRLPMHHSLIHNKPTHLKPDYLPTPYLGKKKKEQHPTPQNIPQIPRKQEAAEELLRERKYMGKERLGGAFVVQ